MKDLAKTLRDQARILRQAEDGDALKGKYADKIREKSGELEKRFRETAGRYERVVGDLGNWANDLEGFQERADRILESAKQADEEHAAEVKKKESEAKKDGDKKQPEDSDADSHLESYRKRLNDVISDRDARAQHYAKNIGDDISDVIKDSGWENFKDWVHKNAEAIKLAVEVLSWAATILGVAAMLFTPIGWLAVAALVATVAVGVGHTLLALSGDGSWTDVAMDVFALVTLRIGTVALKGAKSAYATAKTTSRAPRFDQYKNVRKMLDKNITRYGSDSARGQKAIRAKQRLRELQAGRSQPTPTRMETALHGDKEIASMAKGSRLMRGDFAGNASVKEAADAADKAVSKFKANYIAATAVDLGDKAGEKLVGDPYGNVKDVLTLEVGSRW